MKLLVVLILTTLLVRPLKIPWFEAIVTIFLFTPIVAFLLGPTLGLSLGTYVLSSVIVYTVLALLLFRSKRIELDEKEEGIVVGAFCLLFITINSLCLLWPDFISIGERLRDYAILSSVLKSPLELKEPWMEGVPLFYYAYWYRFGHWLATLLDLKTWEVYNQLQAFTYALYGTASLRLFRKYFGFSWATSAFSAIFLLICSNMYGIYSYLSHEEGWWGPSRVIPGAINEFPVWSFLLGDLHPHYLNLPIVPVALLFGLTLTDYIKPRWSQVFLGIYLTLITTIWIYGANAWELPVWFALVGTFIPLWILSRRERLREFLRELSGSVRDILAPKAVFGLVVTVCVLASLFRASRNLPSADYPWSLVGGEIPRTSLLDMFKHWGFPLLLFTAAIVRLGSPWITRILIGSLIVNVIVFDDALLFLLALFISLVSHLLIELYKNGEKTSLPALVAHSAAIVSLVLVIVPEFIFLDDPYGGENERMNTIFKFYASNWFLIHASAFYLVAQAFSDLRREAVILFQVTTLTFFSMFFFRTIQMRKSLDATIQPREQGLSQIDREFPGAGETIKALRNMPRGVVVEAQGNPYSYTTHVATLSEQPSFLGWINHLNLITRQGDEIGRRDRVSDQIYKESNCEGIRSLMHENQIQYLVVGPLEKKKYPSLSLDTFSCLTRVINQQEYSVFTP